MRYNSIAWGLIFGALINATLYRKGNPIRKAALFVTCGHLFGALSQAYNVDRYFDAVYPIFQADAIKFTKEER
jgi:hypothetical protein